MFQTKSINYSLLAKDSLTLLRDYVGQQKFLKGAEHRPVFLNGHTNWIGDVLIENKEFKPYLNLLKPIIEKLENNNMRIVFVGYQKIDPNTPKTRKHSWRMLQSKKTAVNSMMYIPLEDYSRTDGIWCINNKLTALNTTIVVGPNELNYFENPNNNTYCLIGIGLENTTDEVQSNLA